GRRRGHGGAGDQRGYFTSLRDQLWRRPTAVDVGIVHVARATMPVMGDLVGAALFLCGPEAGFITGQTLVLHAGGPSH
ncbi:MAG: hypothetical protein H7345_03080, partial [Rubritepida sp.]|nr:hypothetical protein [Rubritepida sp.]